MPPKAEKKNNGFDRLRADLKAQTPQNVYLFYGEETYLRSYYLEELHRLLIPAGFEEFNYHRLSGKGLTVQELTEVTEAMPMMAQHTMVVVTDLDIFRLDEQQRTALMALLADFPEYCTLVLVYDLLPYKRDGKMKKLCAALDKPAGAGAAAAMGEAPLCRRRTRHRRRHGGSSAVHLRFPDDGTGAGDREDRRLCQGPGGDSGGYQRCGGPGAGCPGIRHDQRHHRQPVRPGRRRQMVRERHVFGEP